MQPLRITVDPFESIGEWQIDAPFKERVSIEGIHIFLCGLQASHPKFGDVIGSAANVGQHPINNAWYELVERISTVESLNQDSFPLRNAFGSDSGRIGRQEIFPQVDPKNPEFQFSKSNGIALFSTWEEACKRACFELVERHLVLASWTGISKVKNSDLRDFTSQLGKLKAVYDIRRLSFGKQRVSCLPSPVFASGVVLFPKSPGVPLVMAFGAGLTELESMQKAEAETLQRLGFLWGEEIPQVAPDFQPTSLFHQEYYLCPEQRQKVETWIAGELPYKNHATLPDILSVSFADLSYCRDLGLHVAKAYCPEAIPLVFGRWREGAFKALPENFLIHPIA